MIHLAIDLETFSLKENAHILSIGGVFFDPVKGKMGNTFYVEIDPSVDQLGAHISPSTVAWWLSLPNGVCPNGKTPFATALVQFSTFIASELRSGEEVRIYQQGDKDCLWLGNAYSRLGRPLPWKYRNVFCARTLWAHVDTPESFVDYSGTVHNALDDAKFVAHRMINILG